MPDATLDKFCAPDKSSSHPDLKVLQKEICDAESRGDTLATNHKILKDYQDKNGTDSLSFWDKDFQDLIKSGSPESIMRAQKLLNGRSQELGRDKVPVDGKLTGKLTEKLLKILMEPHGSGGSGEAPGG